MINYIFLFVFAHSFCTCVPKRTVTFTPNFCLDVWQQNLCANSCSHFECSFRELPTVSRGRTLMSSASLAIRSGLIIFKLQELLFIIIIIGTTAPFEPRPSSEASASCPYSLQHSSNSSPPTSWHLPSHHLPILVSACPSVSFLLPLQRELFL